MVVWNGWFFHGDFIFNLLGFGFLLLHGCMVVVWAFWFNSNFNLSFIFSIASSIIVLPDRWFNFCG